MLYVLVMDGYNQTSPSCKNGRPDDRPNTPRRCRGSASPTDSPPDCPSDGSAFYHDVIGVDFVAVDRLQSLLVILVEEVVFAELDDLVVHEVQQFGVAFCTAGAMVSSSPRWVMPTLKPLLDLAQASTSVLSVEKASPRPSSSAL